jgi:hypothetical protein
LNGISHENNEEEVFKFARLVHVSLFDAQMAPIELPRNPTAKIAFVNWRSFLVLKIWNAAQRMKAMPQLWPKVVAIAIYVKNGLSCR